jgi:hypothetical protein
MDRRTILTKTGKGLMEATGKTSNLPRDQRNILKEIDGKVSVSALLEKLGKITEPKLLDALRSMEKDGYVREFFGSADEAAAPSRAPAGRGPVSQVPADTGASGEDLDFTSITPKAAPAEDRKGLTAEISHQAAETRAKLAAARAKSEADAKTAAEAKANAEAAARARAEADQKARQAAEAKARADAEARAQADRARREAEERARREAEARAKTETAAKSQADTLDSARREAEERQRREAEEKARREAEARARIEAEESVKRETEERNRRETEEKSRREAEARSRREAEEKARRDAEEKARREAEAKARKEAEERARKEAEERTRREAEERERRARIEAEARAKAEADMRAKREEEERERGRREEELRRRSEEEARKRREAEERDFLERQLREEEEKTRRESEERARAEEERKRKEREERARKEEEEKERAEEEARRREEEEEREKEEAKKAKEEEKRNKEDEKARAKAEAKAQAQARKAARSKDRAGEEAWRGDDEGVRDSAGISARDAWAKRKPRSLGKPIAIGLLLLLAGGVAALPFMPIDVMPYEKAGREWLGVPVQIGSVSLSLLPTPQLKFEKVSIGTDPQIKISVVKAVPEIGSLLGDKKALRSVDLEGAAFPRQYLRALLSDKATGESLRVEKITAKGLKLDIPELAPPPLDVDARLNLEGTLLSVTLSNSERQLTMKLQPQGDKAAIDISSDSFALPIGGDLVVGDFLAKGTISADELALNSVEGRAFDGRVLGNARMRWKGGWSLDGEIEVRGMDASKIASPILAAGTLEGKGVYSMKALLPERMFMNGTLEGNFTIQKGSVTNVDMTRLLQGSASPGGTTLFSEMSGSVSADPNRLQVRNIRLAAGLLNATGQIEMDPQKNLSGRMQVELRSQTVQGRAALTVSGTLKDPQFRRAN